MGGGECKGGFKDFFRKKVSKQFLLLVYISSNFHSFIPSFSSICSSICLSVPMSVKSKVSMTIKINSFFPIFCLLLFYLLKVGIDDSI